MKIVKEVGIPASIILLSMLLYLYSNVFCVSNCYGITGDRVHPIQSGGMWLIPTLVLLFLFKKRIAVLWLRHIGSWFFPISFIGITNLSDGLFFSSDWIANAFMTILFIITLVYALIMNRRLKKIAV